MHVSMCSCFVFGGKGSHATCLKKEMEMESNEDNIVILVKKLICYFTFVGIASVKFLHITVSHVVIKNINEFNIT